MAEEKRGHFTEIDVERINIVDKDGNLRMALFNSERIPEIMIDGNVQGKRKWDTKFGTNKC